jgi:hypothetical protein
MISRMTFCSAQPPTMRSARAGNPHASYHVKGRFHQKSHERAMLPQQRQPLTAAFKESEHLGIYHGHGTSIGRSLRPKHV